MVDHPSGAEVQLDLYEQHDKDLRKVVASMLERDYLRKP